MTTFFFYFKFKLMSDNGGCHAFFATFRPREGISDTCVTSIIGYLPTFCKYYFVVLEKEGTERHAHVVFFPTKPLQRSNVITMLVRKCCTGWSADELANFRRWDKANKTGAVKVATHLNIITDYLDGTRETKSADKFSVEAQHLPADLHVLEQWMPAVGALVKPKNVKFHTLHKQLISRFVMPDIDEGDHLSFTYLLSCVKYLENHDIREADCDPRRLKAFLQKFLQWYNRDTFGRFQDGTSSHISEWEVNWAREPELLPNPK